MKRVKKKAILLIILLTMIVVFINNKKIVQILKIQSSVPQALNTTIAEELIKDAKDTNSLEHNTTYLQQLIDETSKEGGIIHIPAGTYYFSAGGNTYGLREETNNNNEYYVVKCKDNVTIEGEGADEETGTIFKPMGDYEYSLDMFYFNDLADTKIGKYLENANFKDFVIDSELTHGKKENYNAYGKGFMINLFKDCSWNNIIVKNTDGTGFGMDCPINSTITNCKAIGCGKLADSNSIGASGFGIGTGYSEEESIYINDCQAIGNRKFGFFFEHQGRFVKTYQAKKAQGFIVTDCIGIGNKYDFGGERSNDTTFKNCTSKIIKDTDPNPLNIENVSSFYFGNNSRRVRIKDCKSEKKFIDVTDNTSFYYIPAYWALNNALVDGDVISEFAPTNECSRAQAMVLLWRATGRQGDVVLYNDVVQAGYTDVENNIWYADSLKWGKQIGILDSTSTEFFPDIGCSRADFITMLWRYAGKPLVETKNSFTDNVPGSYYEKAVDWACDKNILDKNNGEFLPDRIYTRGEVVTLLYRYFSTMKTVTYNYTENGGEQGEKIEDEKREGEDIDLNVKAVKEGYEFIGWNTDKNAENGLTELTMQGEDIILYAIFKKDIKLTFIDYEEDREVQREKDITIYNKKVGNAVAPKINEYNGWISKYWTIGEDADAQQEIENEGNIENILEDRIYYGRYSKQIRISFDLNEGEGEDIQEVTGNIEVNSRDINKIKELEIVMPDTNVTKLGYIFKGWNTNSNGLGLDYEKSQKGKFTEDTVLYVKWVQDTEYNSDKMPPQVTILPNQGEQAQKSYEVTVNVEDEISGVDANSLKYQWTQNQTQPEKESFVDAFQNGGNITKSEGDGKWYLWIYAKDTLGNETITSSEAFNFDNTKPKLKVSYSPNQQTTGKVTAIITSNEPVQAVTDWQLSTNMLELTKEYSSNTKDTIKVKDIAGNESEIQVSIENIIEPEESVKKGDIDEDGKIDSTDLIKMLRHIVANKDEEIASKNPTWILTGKKYKIADIDNNNQINTTDVLKLLRHISASKDEETKRENPDWIIK